MIGRSLASVVVGTALGGVTAGLYALVFALLWAAIHEDLSHTPDFLTRFALAGAAAGGIVGACRALDRARDYIGSVAAKRTSKEAPISARTLSGDRMTGTGSAVRARSFRLLRFFHPNLASRAADHSSASCR